MKYPFTLMLLLATAFAAAQTDTTLSDPVKLENESDSISYFLGLMFGYDISEFPFQANTDLIISGIQAAYHGTTLYDRESTRAQFRELQQAFQQREAENERLAAIENLEKSNRFLEDISTREGVVTTGSGLRYEVLVEGGGPLPADTSTVTVHYEGTLMDGSVFDSSYDRGEPSSFPLNRVIRGWTEGVQLMPVGSTYRFYIPPDLGYGDQGSGPIPGNSVLIFKVELLGIE
jgi:FKBP-type peptidyl-prolyl cis-trans isomerase FkpA